MTVAQLREFITLLPDWDELALGLDAISIWSGNERWLGLSNPGVVVITAWNQDLWWDVEPEFLVREPWVTAQLGAETGPASDDGLVELRWTLPQARAYMLLDVLVHELGHHHDRMTTGGTDAPRGEPYAIGYADRVREAIFPEYVDRFGI